MKDKSKNRKTKTLNDEKKDKGVKERNCGDDRLVELEKKCQELAEGWKRSQAEFLNYKTRTEREKLELADFVRSDVVKDFLSVYDNLRRGYKMVEDKTGYEMVIKAFLEILKNKYQIVLMDCAGKFEAEKCEAIGFKEVEGKSGEIAEVVEDGFVCGDKVVRPARVLLFK